VGWNGEAGIARRGLVGTGMARLGRLGGAWLREAGSDTVCLGMAGAGRFGRSGSGLAESGKVRQAWRGWVRNGMAR